LDDIRGNEADGFAQHAGREVRFVLGGEDDGTITRFELVS
jgi:hypothetical protein